MPFRKRFYRPRAFVSDLAGIVWHLPDLVSAARSKRVSHALGEKIMLVVTGVNGCRYCSYAHTRMALRNGVGAEELEKLLTLDLDGFPPDQVVALAFAQHYAESGCHPDPAAARRFHQYYGPQWSQDIMSYVRFISFANLCGNTVDAFLSRLHGDPAEASSALGELVLFAILAPFVLPMLPLMKRTGRAAAGRG
jgi:AhpD family alkylhydroperoxidase